jgi:hypothetical protein
MASQGSSILSFRLDFLHFLLGKWERREYAEKHPLTRVASGYRVRNSNAKSVYVGSDLLKEQPHLCPELDITLVIGAQFV